MANIKVIIKDGDKTRESIHPQESLANFQRVYKQDLIDYYLVDKDGIKIQGEVKALQNPKEKALDAMRAKAKSLKIKGYHLMGEDALLKAIQEAHKAETKTA